MQSRLSLALLVGAAYGLVGCGGDGPTSATEPNEEAVFGVNASRANDGRTGDLEVDHAPGFRRGFPPLAHARAGIIDPLSDDRFAGTWHVVEFDPPFHPKMQVIVIPMTQTYNGGEPPVLRVRNVTNEGFEIRFDEVNFFDHVANGRVQADGNHLDEAVGWVALAVRGPHDGELVVSR